MKRILLYIGILAALVLAPAEQMEVGKLLPVQAVSVYMDSGVYVIETDTENRGTGPAVELAVQNLKDTAAGTVYLDTAQYLLVAEDAQGAVESLRNKLKPSVKLTAVEGQVDMKRISKFLDAHEELPKLKHWKIGDDLPVLSKFEDSFIFLKKVEKSA